MDSIRNCSRMFLRFAPMALRMPISRHEHDVHDADAADQQRNARNAAQHQRQCAGRLVGSFKHLRLIHDRIGAVILIFFIEEVLYNLLRRVHAGGINGGDVNR